MDQTGLGLRFVMKRDTVNPCASPRQRTANLFGAEYGRRADRRERWMRPGVVATRTRAGDSMGNLSTAAGRSRARGGNALPGVAHFYFPL